MASIDSFRPRRDSHNHQPRVKPTSFRVSLKTRTLIRPTVNTQPCDWWPWETNTLMQRCFLSCAINASNRTKREVEEKSGRRKQGGNENVGGSGLLERRKRKTGVQDFAQQMLKRPQCLLRANGSLLAGKSGCLQHVFNCRF